MFLSVCLLYNLSGNLEDSSTPVPNLPTNVNRPSTPKTSKECLIAYDVYSTEYNCGATRNEERLKIMKGMGFILFVRNNMSSQYLS